MAAHIAFLNMNLAAGTVFVVSIVNANFVQPYTPEAFISQFNCFSLKIHM
jgi:hypothetical protein